MVQQASPTPLEFNIYDFDHTLYDGDCSIDFYFFCITRQPSLLRYIPIQALHLALFLLKIESRTSFKSNFFVYLRGIKDIDSMVALFWKRSVLKLKSWYRATNYQEGVIISASPKFLLQPALSELGINALIATDMDTRRGTIKGENCYGEEKVRRFRKQFPQAIVREAYSDSEVDAPMLRLAEKQYRVKGETVTLLNG